jgi:tRNA-2-methylthio-N6-dimethylallyladenosine synthase
MNQRDSEALSCLLEERGHQACESENEADIVIFNTCSVREQAELKVMGKVGILKRLKKQKPHLVLGIIGCMAQNHGESLLKQFPHLDFVLGTDQMHHLPDLIEEILNKHNRLVQVETGNEILGTLTGHRQTGFSAFVSIMRGCNQFCTYCIVPYVRGREKSRDVEGIVAEVRTLAERGVKEVMLLGQNVNVYGVAEARREGRYDPEACPFAEVLQAVNDVPGIERIRFTSPHPGYMNAAFIEAVTQIPKVCESFHLPLQSGSNQILKRMHRGYTVEQYLDTIRQIRARKPEVTFSTDIIVGFPGETAEDFEATRAVMREVGFDMAYIFKYSPRRGTKAAELPDDVPQSVKEERNQILLQELNEHVTRANRELVGRTVEVLVEGESKRNSQRWSGRTRTNKVCIFKPVANLQAGDLVQVTIDRTTAHSLFGCLGSVK